MASKFSLNIAKIDSNSENVKNFKKITKRVIDHENFEDYIK